MSSPTGQVLFDGDIHVHYGFLVLERGDRDDRVLEDLLAARGGQSNGLCGARFPHHLVMATGLHTGGVPVRVERHDGAPVLDDRWEDVVEVPFDVADDEYALVGFDGGAALTGLPLGSCRARWSAKGMDAAHRQDTRLDGEPAPDRYLLQVWPAPPAPDDVLRQGSEQAAYWHGVARDTAPPPPPPPPPTAAELAALEVEEERRRLADAEAFELHWTWGGAAPSADLLAAGGRSSQLAAQDRALAEALVALPPEHQRALAVRAARVACGRARVEHRAWVADGLDRVARGEPLPPLWDDWAALLDLLFPVEEGTVVERLVVATVGEAPPREPLAPEVAAVDAVLAAAEPGAAAAVTGAVDALASADEEPERLFAEVRRWLAEPPPAG